MIDYWSSDLSLSLEPIRLIIKPAAYIWEQGDNRIALLYATPDNDGNVNREWLDTWIDILAIAEETLEGK